MGGDPLDGGIKSSSIIQHDHKSRNNLLVTGHWEHDETYWQKVMDGIRDQGKYRMADKGCILEQWSQQKSDFGIFKDKWTKM